MRWGAVGGAASDCRPTWGKALMGPPLQPYPSWMAPSPAFEISTAEFPIVVVRTFRAMSDEDHEEFFRAFAAVYARRERFATITDLRQFAGVPTAKQRQRMAAWYNETKPLLKRYSLGHALVLNSAIMRGAMTALRWIVPAEVPEVYLPTVDLAREFCVERLRLAGIDVVPNRLALPSHMRLVAGREMRKSA